jgi:hypothetical protein
MSAALAALVLFSVGGCVRVPVQRDKIETRLISATANGQTILCWESRTDLLYTVLVADRFETAQWKQLEGFVNLRGTGGTMQFQLAEDPHHPRTYKLRALPLTKTR